MGFDQRLLGEINTVRRAHGLTELRPSGGLESAALSHSRDMADHGFFAHMSSDGMSLWQRITAFYPIEGYRRWRVGEAIFWWSPKASVDEVVRAWLRSPEHRSLILGRTWQDVGVAAVRVAAGPGAFNGLRVTIVTADFGCRDH